MNKLLTEIRRSLTEIGLGLAGALNMSDAMDALAASLQVNRVPSRRPGLIIAHMSIYGNNH
jgi:dynein heavy chain, axonemal